MSNQRILIRLVAYYTITKGNTNPGLPAYVGPTLVRFDPGTEFIADSVDERGFTVHDERLPNGVWTFEHYVARPIKEIEPATDPPIKRKQL